MAIVLMTTIVASRLFGVEAADLMIFCEEEKQEKTRTSERAKKLPTPTHTTRACFFYPP